MGDITHVRDSGHVVAGLLLAAGRGRRLGTPKAVLELGGRRLVDRGAATLRDGGCDPVHVVTGAVRATVAGAVEVHNPHWDRGRGTSLRVGLDALPRRVEAVVIALVDQPLVTPAAVRRLVEAFGNGARAAVATYAGAPRNPVLLAREHWPSAHALAEGDEGARPFLRAYSHLVTGVPCADVARPDDIDTPDDLARVRRLCEGHGAGGAGG